MTAEQGAFMQNLLLSSRKFEEEKQYWLDQLSGDLQFSMFPGEKNRGASSEQIHEVMNFTFSPAISDSIFRITGRSESGTFILLLAGVMYVLHRYLDSDDITVGIPAPSGAMDTVQLSAIRIDFGKERSFKELVLELRSTVGTAKKFSHLSLEKILELLGHDGDTMPRMATVVRMDNMQESSVEAGHDAEMQFSFQLTDTGLALRVEYNAALYSQAIIEQITDHLTRVLSYCAARPDHDLHQVNLLSLKESQLIQQLNDTEVHYSNDHTVIQMFQFWSVHHPDVPAVLCGDHTLTYWELDYKSNRLARHLRTQGVDAGIIVGILLSRSEEMLVAMLAVLKTGAAYMPLDPAYAENRLQFMLEDSQSSVLLTHNELSNSLEYNGQTIDISLMEQRDDPQTPLPEVSLEQLAYLIYTSGSTGRPKGVMIEHLALRNFVEGVSRRVAFESGKRILALTTISFDIFVLETLGALANGLTLVMAQEEDQMNPSRIAGLILTHNVEVLQITPSRLRMLQIGLTEDSPVWDRLRILMIGGEALPHALYEEISGMTSARIYNMYGPTETTVWSSVQELSVTSAISIGQPIANTRMYILDKQHRHMPVGATGELCIAGDGVARGYWNRPELTAAMFVKDPFHENSYMYKTGDLARFTTHGDVEYLGRSDFQVKVRGYRIELGEIENRLLQYPDISAAAVTVRADQDGQSLLCAYYTVTNNQRIALERLRAFLLAELPEYMMPSTYTLLEELPYTANGKIDRKALPEPLSVQGGEKEITLPGDPWEQLLAGMWSELLQLREIDIHARFFEIGGHSLNVIKLEANMEKRNIPLTAEEVMLHETIATLAEVLRTKGYEPDGDISFQVHDVVAEDSIVRSAGRLYSTGQSDYRSNDSHVSTVVIDGIEPFNDVFYKNCFYNSLFPILNLYGLGVMPVLINDRMQYVYDEHQGLLQAKYQAVLSDVQLMERMGLEHECRNYCEDVQKDIIEAIHSNRPVIIRVDCYYESLRKDMYSRVHWPHSLLIYGFDLQRQIFHVIEHDHRDNLTYQSMEMPFEDVVQAYEGFIHLYAKDEALPTFYAFSELESAVHGGYPTELEDLREEFMNNLRVTPEEMNQEMNHLQSFMKRTRRLGEENCRSDLAYAELVLQSVVEIVNAKKVETYRMQRLSEPQADLVNAVQAVQDHWSDLRNVLAKSVYRQSVTGDQWKKVTSKLEAIYELEKHNFISC
ncbi:hypothetical protein C0Q44_11180 [Paenibacillus sp. PCH8]|uniref:non-ribosomal peptide synthetase n=1 Tax=Paenibacillus sp. PCH8 TaxID=2066524 RepID=UPI000CF94007|nr:non-ribosomal peptide synthetase [Paenibacillus sp. PCH8]PQP85029.1 hypothetical protein C0Q44_11180 [Paenibacillus sp. PCH8]